MTARFRLFEIIRKENGLCQVDVHVVCVPPKSYRVFRHFDFKRKIGNSISWENDKETTVSP